MNRNILQTMKILLLVLAVVMVVSISNFSNTTDQYMVRVVLLQQEGAFYQVGVLYQNPDAAANSADVQASLQFSYAEGDSFAAAFQALEQTFLGELSYQLSDYLLLCGQCSKEALTAYAAQIQTTQTGRYAAQVSYLSQTISELEAFISADVQVAHGLLEQLEIQQAPYLYQVTDETMAMPLYEIAQDGGVAPAQTMYLLQADGFDIYDETQTQLYRLLSGTKDICYFSNSTVSFCVQHRILSYTGTLAGVSSNPSSIPVGVFAQQTDGAAQTERFVLEKNEKTLHLYALLLDTQDISDTTLVNIELYLEYLANNTPALLAQLGVQKVEVHLMNLAQWV